MDDRTLWTEATKLEDPTVAELQSLAGARALPEPVFPSGLSLFQLRDNVIVKISMAETISEECRPLGVVLCVAASALQKALVKIKTSRI